MKGILYAYLTLNKKYWLVAAVCFVFSIMLGIYAICIVPQDAEAADIASMIVPISSLLAPIMLSEAMPRDLEANIKSRFAYHILSAGVSKHCYVTSYLLVNLVPIALGIGLIALEFSLLSLFTAFKGIFAIFPLLALITTAGNLVNWIAMPITIFFKSAEKAVIIIGLIAAIGISIPALINIDLFKQVMAEKIYEILVPSAEFQLIAYGVIALLYAIFYIIFYKCVKRGDL